MGNRLILHLKITSQSKISIGKAFCYCCQNNPKGTNPDHNSVHFGSVSENVLWSRRAKMYWNVVWKGPRFVPFGANLTHIKPKSDIPVLNNSLQTTRTDASRGPARHTDSQYYDLCNSCTSNQFNEFSLVVNS